MSEDKIEWTTMWRDLLGIYSFVEQKFTDEKLKARLLPVLQEASEAFNSTLRTSRPKEKLKRIDRALAALKRASVLEKRWLTSHHKNTWGSLYSGSSQTPYSDLIEAQKGFPNEAYIWAFEKKLKVYREQIERG